MDAAVSALDYNNIAVHVHWLRCRKLRPLAADCADQKCPEGDAEAEKEEIGCFLRRKSINGIERQRVAKGILEELQDALAGER